MWGKGGIPQSDTGSEGQPRRQSIRSSAARVRHSMKARWHAPGVESADLTMLGSDKSTQTHVAVIANRMLMKDPRDRPKSVCATRGVYAATPGGREDRREWGGRASNEPYHSLAIAQRWILRTARREDGSNRLAA